MPNTYSTTPASIQKHYQDLLGVVPDTLALRQRLAQATERLSAINAIEQLRKELLDHNPLDRRTQQLVQFAMLVGRGEAEAAQLHAAAAFRAGASLRDLQGVVETAAIVCGMPGVGLAVRAVAGLVAAPASAGEQ